MKAYRLSYKIFVIILLLLSLIGCLLVFTPREVTEEQALESLLVALEQEGKPYSFGEQSPHAGFDCSGLVIWAYQQVIPGIRFMVNGELETDATVEELYDNNIRKLNIEEIKPGDLIFLIRDGELTYPTHMGLFVRWIDKTKFEIIHASSYWGKVIIEVWSLNEVIRGHRFYCAGRLQYYSYDIVNGGCYYSQ